MLAGCAGGRPGGPATWTAYAADVTGVRRGSDARTLLIDVSLPAGHPDCARAPRVDQYTEENRSIYANVVFESARSGVVGGCPAAAPGVATLRAPGPVGDRVVVLNQQAWAPDGPRYRRCDPVLGCAPPADHCDTTWVLAAVNGLDVPRNSARNIAHCDQAWLVLTLDVNSTACGAGGRPGCSAPPSVSRYFLRFTAPGWRVVARTAEGGCRAVLAVAPDFPRALCAHLPPTLK
ncbi:MAG: hypothetical protein V7603_3249 [Micromonosporaceae bacterium]